MPGLSESGATQFASLVLKVFNSLENIWYLSFCVICIQTSSLYSCKFKVFQLFLPELIVHIYHMQMQNAKTHYFSSNWSISSPFKNQLPPLWSIFGDICKVRRLQTFIYNVFVAICLWPFFATQISVVRRGDCNSLKDLTPCSQRELLHPTLFLLVRALRKPATWEL